jgi:hypothetical protein
LSEQQDQLVKSGTYNNLNQLTARNPGGVIPIKGTLSKPANVTVNGDPAEVNLQDPPKTSSFTAYLPVKPGTNNFSIVSQELKGTTTTKNYSVTITGSGSNSYTYDLDGNLLSDGINTYLWDQLNRLIVINEPGSR